MKTRLVLAMMLVLSAAASTQAAMAKRTIALDNANVTKYGGRFRVTKNAWNFALLTIRDNFKVWSPPGGAGANLLLDPGYDYLLQGAAGPVRTTPYLWDYVRYDPPIVRSNYDLDCGNCLPCGGCNADRTCDRLCSKGAPQGANPLWIQVKRYGANLSTNYPPVPGEVQPVFREYGFYVADPGADFKEMEFCTVRYSYDSGSGKSGPCTDPTQSFDICVLFCTTIYFDYDARLFIFPNMRSEYMGVNATFPHDPAQSWDSWNPPVNRGCFSGLSTTNIVRTFATVTDCRAWPYATCSEGGGCCCSWCLCVCSSWSSACVNSWYTMSRYVYYAPIGAPFAPSTAKNARDGTYIRPGDDQALYTNVGQMQIHSIDRNTFLGTESVLNTRGCPQEWQYTGSIVSGKPQLLNTGQKAANCLYPKSYWDGTKWKACDPYDTWNADGTLNPSNDDAKWLYPGDPNTGAGGSPGRCGRQPACTPGSCTVGANGAYLPGSYTTRFKDLLVPGGGWYFMRINDIQFIPGADPPNASSQPKIALDLVIPDVRVEVGLALDAYISGALVTDQAIRNIRGLGQIKMTAVTIGAEIYVYSVDDSSCVTTSPATCAAPFNSFNNNQWDPDQIYFDVNITNLTITAPDPWYVGECDNIFIDIIWGIGITISACDFINDNVCFIGICFSLGVKQMLIDTVENALRDQIVSAIEEFIATVPNLNNILGNPINLANKSLIETGIYATGGMNEKINMPDGTARWPVHLRPGPSADREVTDFRFSVGFKPIAFRPPVGVNNVMDIDTNDPPLSDSMYGVPTLMDPNTFGCSTANCSRGSHYASPDTDQMWDGEDYAKTSSGGYWNPKSPYNWITPGQYQRLPEYYQGPIGQWNKPPAWCSAFPAAGIGAPRTIRSGGGTTTDFNNLYPQSTWLSFNTTLDQAPSGSGLATPASRNTFGGWDSMDPGTVFLQNSNTGAKDPSSVPYDFSFHVHQRAIAQFLQAMVSSGATCLEFAAKDTTGADTPWKSLLAVETFAAILPDLTREFPGRYMKVRMSVTGTPRARTGMGTLAYTPSINTPPGEAPLAIAPTAYMLSAVFPDTRIEFVVDDPVMGDVPFLTMYWTPVLGLHLQSVRKCYYLDPLVNDQRCTSTFVNVRTVSGYYEVYIDIGSDSLKSAWVNPKDFPAGYFSDIGTARFFDGAAPLAEKKHIAIASTYCDTSPTCNLLGISQLVPTLMDSFISLFFVTRLSFYNLTLDFLYTGVDGPNDDGVGGGDYIGIYGRFLGSLDFFSLLGDLDSILAPQNAIEPMAMVPSATEEVWFATNRPVFPIQLVGQAPAGQSELAYTYSLDGGFWKTQRRDAELALGPLGEGEHKLLLRAVEHTKRGAIAQMTPQVVSFRVDTVAPEVHILPSPKGVYESRVEVQAQDFQTPADKIRLSYAWDGDSDWQEMRGKSISLRWLKSGVHTLRVRAVDQAGNVGEVARQVTLAGGANWWGCGPQGLPPDAAWLLVATFAWLYARRRGAKVRRG